MLETKLDVEAMVETTDDVETSLLAYDETEDTRLDDTIDEVATEETTDELEREFVSVSTDDTDEIGVVELTVETIDELTIDDTADELTEVLKLEIWLETKELEAGTEEVIIEEDIIVVLG
jgi:hypothetical protein